MPSTPLAAGPQHGYAIMADAERISGGVTRLQTGTLLRRYYRLTDDGAPAPPSPPSG